MALPEASLTTTCAINDAACNGIDVEGEGKRLLGSSSMGAVDPLAAKRDSRKRLLNVIIMALGFMVVFCGFIPTQGYMTSINKDLGNISLFILYFVMAFTNFISPFVVKLCGVRLSMLLGALCYSVYVAATISSKAEFLLPASVIIGVGSAVLWTAQGDYLSRCSTHGNIGFLSGVFFGIYQIASLVGSVGTGILLDSGANYQFVFIILTGVSLCGVSLFFFCGRMEPSSGLGATTKDASEVNPLKATFSLMNSKRFVFLIGMMIFSGISQAFYAGIFPPVVKETGESNVAWFLAIWGSAEIIGSFASGKFSDIWGRSTVVYIGLSLWIVGFGLSVGASLDKDIRLLASFFSGFCLGAGDACLNTSLYAIFGVIFKGKSAPAFAGFKFVQSLALGLGFGLGIVLECQWYAVMSVGLLVIAAINFVYLQRSVVNVDLDEEQVTNPVLERTLNAGEEKGEEREDIFLIHETPLSC